MKATHTLRLLLAGLSSGAWALLAAESPPDRTAPITLKANWPVGRRMVQRVAAGTDQKMTIPGAQEPMNQKTSQVMEYSVAVASDLNGGGKELAVEFLALQIQSTMGAQTVLKFDSKSDAKDDAANPMNPMLRPFIGAKLKVLTTPSGKLDKVQGLDLIRDQVMKNAPPAMAPTMQGMFGDGMIDQLGLLPTYLPEKPVSIDAEWPTKIEMFGGPLGTITLNGTTRFAKWEKHQDRDCVVLEGKGRVWNTPKPGAASMGSVSGDYRTTTWFDPKDGLQIESVSTQNLVARLKVMDQEMTIPSVQIVTNLLVSVTTAPKE